MATTPTNLPVPSESPRDLKFNAGKIDEFVTSSELSYADRFGNKHYTIEGISQLSKDAMASFGYITMDSFEDGNTLTLPNQVLRLEATGEYYRWDGAFPKVVPAASTPDSTGGIGAGKWLSVGDSTLRGQISDPDGATKYPELQIARWRDEGDVRGWGEGEDGFNAAMTEMSENGGGVLYVNEDITFSAIPIMHKPKVTVYWNGNRAIVPSGLTATYGYIMDGGADTPVYDNTDHFTRANKTNCYGLRLEASDYTVGVNAIGVCVRHCYGYTYEGGAIIGFNNGGYYDEFCYEGKVSKFTMVVSNARGAQSIGLNSNTTDTWYSEISPVGYAYGGKMNRSGNSLDKFHSWGNTIDDRVGLMGKMHVGLWVTENGGFSTYTNLILDTPVRRDSSSVPSRSNGGVGLINDAWDTSFDGVLVSCSKNDAVVKSTLPVIASSQDVTYKDLSVSNPTYATDIWVSFENNSGIALNHILGYGYAQLMRNGAGISSTSGATFAPASGVTISSQTLSSGIWYNTLNFSIKTTITATSSASSDVIVNIAPMYGVRNGFGGAVKGGLDAFFYATANTSKQLYDVYVEVTSANTAKFLLTFIDGATRYARWTDVSNGSARAISVSCNIEIK